MCRYHQTSPDSHFTKGRLCSRADGGGRLTLSGMRFIETDANGERRVRTLTSEDEYTNALREHFGIELSSGG